MDLSEQIYLLFQAKDTKADKLKAKKSKNSNPSCQVL